MTRVEAIRKFNELNFVNTEHEEKKSRELKKREIKAAKNLTLIVIFFGVCWMVRDFNIHNLNFLKQIFF